MTLYQAYRVGISGTQKLLPVGQTFNITEKDKDHYHSLFYYGPKHKEVFDVEHSVKGMTGTNTDKLFFDFDSKDVELARKDAEDLGLKLVDALNVPIEAIKVFFSGNKGFHLEVALDRKVNNQEFKAAVFKLACEYNTFDRVVNDENRVIRLNNSKHLVSGLYKIELTPEELVSLSVEQIKELAKAPRNLNIVRSIATLDESLFAVPEEEKKENIVAVAPILDLDFNKKPKGWSNCKWSLLNGNFEIGKGQRNVATHAIIATCEHLNFPKEAAYYMAKSACKMALERHRLRFGKDSGTEYEKDRLWASVETIYSPSWKGGMYSCRDGKSPWLTDICNDLGAHKCKGVEEKTNLIEVDAAFGEFAQFAKDIDKNTVKTGIDLLDQAVRCRTGQMIGVLGAPSSGKTSVALEILENTSRQGLLSVFYSLDMANSELFLKIAQRVTGFDESKVCKLLQAGGKEAQDIKTKICAAYGNVKFCFDTGVSVEAIDTAINDFEASQGKKVVLLLLDYNELISSPYSDATAASGYNAGALKKLTNLRQLCTVSLLQPPKVVGDASDEIYSYRNIKGSSLLEQCFSIVVGLFRPGFNPKNSDDDRFMVMNVLKNRMGKLANLKFNWDGSKGKITTLNDPADEEALDALMAAKKAASSGGLF